MTHKKIIFLGSRFHVLEELLLEEGVSNIVIYALAGSLLEKILIEKQISFNVFSMDDKEQVLEGLLASEFDILISNGCPFIFPENKFKKHQILIIIHPTYLPYLPVKTPLKGIS